MKTFLLSLKTTVWTLILLICFFFVGSYMMPLHRNIFSSMNDDILLAWVARSSVDTIWYTGWLFAAFAGLVLLSLNTIVCSIKAVRDKWSRSNALLSISPQIIHLGFLFILFAHLLGAAFGYRVSGALSEGAYARLPDGNALYLRSAPISMRWVIPETGRQR